jgi:hypothetical protein
LDGNKFAESAVDPIDFPGISVGRTRIAQKEMDGVLGVPFLLILGHAAHHHLIFFFKGCSWPLFIGR